MDTQIVCKDCNVEFPYTESEQKFFESKGFNAPVRCKDCRIKAKQRKEQNGGGGFNRDDRGGSRNRY